VARSASRCIEVPAEPERITDCNCSICRRLGVLWAYYPPTEVGVHGPADGIVAYVRRDLDEPAGLAFHHCRVCGCTTHWRRLDPARDDRMGVNARLMDPGTIKGARVRKLDGAVTWTYVDKDG